MTRALSNVALFCAAVVVSLVSSTASRAEPAGTPEPQSQPQSTSSDAARPQTAIDELKGKIFDARMAQQMLGKGLRFCSDLNGKGFYFHLRDRVLDLEDYFHSLENMVKAEVYNPEKRRPWSMQDAKDRWEAVKKQAEEDKQKCELAKSLPQLEKQLQDLEAKNESPGKKD